MKNHYIKAMVFSISACIMLLIILFVILSIVPKEGIPLAIGILFITFMGTMLLYVLRETKKVNSEYDQLYKDYEEGKIEKKDYEEKVKERNKYYKIGIYVFNIALILKALKFLLSKLFNF